MFAPDLTGPIQPLSHYVGLTIEYQLGLLLFCVTAVIAGTWDWKVRGAPFKTFIPSFIGGVLILSYEFATAKSFAFTEILAVIVIVQVATIGGIGLFLYFYGITGNDDAMWLFAIALIPIGAGVIVVIGAILVFIHRTYRKYNHITENPYKDRYKYYPYPFVSYGAIAVVCYTVYILITAIL